MRYVILTKNISTPGHPKLVVALQCEACAYSMTLRLDLRQPLRLTSQCARCLSVLDMVEVAHAITRFWVAWDQEEGT
jgi:hypothetical protein